MFRGNQRFRKDKVSRPVLDRSWADLARQKGSEREAFGDLSWVKKGKEKRCEKRSRLGRLGGLQSFVVG